MKFKVGDIVKTTYPYFAKFNYEDLFIIKKIIKDPSINKNYDIISLLPIFDLNFKPTHGKDFTVSEFYVELIQRP